MARRSYDQYCGLARALDVVGERWTLLVVRNLLLGPTRYSELLHGLPGITTNLLAARLRGMEAAGLIERVRTSAAASAHAYRLTPEGRALEPALHALARWGAARMGAPTKRDRRSIEWLLVSLRRRYRGGAAMTVELLVDGVPYTARATGDALEIARGAPPAADLRLAGSLDAVAAPFLRGLDDGLPRGLVVDGPVDRLQALVAAVDPMPSPAAGKRAAKARSA